MTTDQHVIWAEKYRPTKIEDCILPSFLKDLVKQIISSGEVPNLLLIGSAGIGKTTLAKAICTELDLDYLMLNASIGGAESGIDALRTNIQRFVATRSVLNDKRKVVIFDEADNLSPHGVQPALRNFMEEYSKFSGFILTANYPHKVIPELHSRCTKIDCNILIQDERKEIMKSIFTHVNTILKAEGIKSNDKVLVQLIKETFPDIRHLLNLLQGWAKAKGEITEGILAVYRDTNFDDVVTALKEKNWSAARNWVFAQPNIRPEVYSKIYKVLETKVSNKSKPALVIILNDHQVKHASAVDKGICLLSALTEVMGNCEIN